MRPIDAELYGAFSALRGAQRRIAETGRSDGKELIAEIEAVKQTIMDIRRKIDGSEG